MIRRVAASLIPLGVLLGLGAAATAQPADTPWPMFHRDAANTGRSQAVGPNEGVVLWSRQLGDAVESPPAIGPTGTIYQGCRDGHLYALAPEDGSIRWSLDLGAPVYYSAPAVGGNGRIYVGTTDGLIHAVEDLGQNGTPCWSEDLRQAEGEEISIASSPTIGADGTIYIGTCLPLAADTQDGGRVCALRDGGTSASVVWVYPDDCGGSAHGIVRSSPAIGPDGAVYVGDYNVGTTSGVLHAIKVGGCQRWVYPMDAGGKSAQASPTVTPEGTIYVGSDDDGLHAISPDGSRKWRFALGSDGHSCPALGQDGTIYVASERGRLYAIRDLGTTYEILWDYDTGADVQWSSPALSASGVLYYGDQAGRFHAVRDLGTTYEILWDYDTGSPMNFCSPAIGEDGTVYVGNRNGMLYAFGTSPTTIEIDIKPGSYPNSVNLGSQGLVPVAILSSADFDATQADPATVELAGADVAVRGRGNKYMAHAEDVNSDGLLDMVVQVETENLNPDEFQDGYAILTGTTVGGEDFEGSDEITIVPE